MFGKAHDKSQRRKNRAKYNLFLQIMEFSYIFNAMLLVIADDLNYHVKAETYINVTVWVKQSQNWKPIWVT